MKLTDPKKIVYTAYSKYTFYLKEYISAFVINSGYIPLNPFTNWGYFMSDLVDRDLIRNANFNLVRLSNEIWVFGIISDGVVAELDFALKHNIHPRFFEISSDGKKVEEIDSSSTRFEEDAFTKNPQLKQVLGIG